ncbi:MAG: non-canonical purine NTP pyrophosphatase [Gemmatimonadales bacterium]
MRLLIATRSLGKQAEARRLLEAAGHEVVFPDEAGVPGTSIEETLEIEATFVGNARKKAEYFQRKTGLPTVADDSGLEVLSLGGEPGVRSKRWAGAQGSPDEIDAANNAELLRRLRGASAARRTAQYRCILVLLRSSDAKPEVFEGTCAGRILEAPAGTGGFGYDQLFWSAELDQSFGEATAEEKDRVSHRGRAFRGLLKALRDR